MTQVTGLRWGDYIGSPDHSSPIIAWSSDHKQTAVKLAALSTGEVFGLDPFSTLLVRETGKHLCSSLSIVTQQLVCCYDGKDIFISANEPNAEVTSTQ